MRKTMAVLLLLAAFFICFNSGFDVAENRNAAEIRDLLENNLRLQAIVNVYRHNYGILNEQDAEAFFGKKNNSSVDEKNGRIGPF